MSLDLVIQFWGCLGYNYIKRYLIEEKIIGITIQMKYFPLNWKYHLKYKI